MSPAQKILSTLANTIAISKTILSKRLSQLKEKAIKSFTSLQFIVQLIIYYIVVLIILGFIIVYVRILIYPIAISTNYTTGYQMAFSDGVIRKAIINIVQYAGLESDSQSENELSQILFMKIYFKELLEHKLLDGKSFRNANSLNDYYAYLNQYFDANFNIDKSTFKEMVDDNESLGELKELFKVSFLFTPLLIQEAFINDNYLFSVYFLPYKFDKSNLKYIHKGYFHYPTVTLQYTLQQNFNQINKLTDPDINDSVTPNHLSADTVAVKEYSTDNWFVSLDYYFRVKSKESSAAKTLSNLIFYNEAEIESDIINRSHFEVLQFIPDNQANEPIVINLIFKYKERNSSESAEYFSFILQNSTFDPNRDKLLKYSDNSSFVITRNAIAPLSISDKYLNFFNYVFNRKDYLFNTNGENFDTFDLERLNVMENYFSVPDDKQGDVLIFKTMHMMYSIMIQKLNSNQKSTVLREDYYLYNYTDRKGINEICESMDLLKHYKYLKATNVKLNCLSHDQMFYYLQSHGLEYDTTEEGSLPDCACLPFYCLNITNSDLREGRIEFTDTLNIPNSCETSMNSYYSPQSILEKAKKINIEKNIFTINKISFKYKIIPYMKSVDILNVHNYFNYHMLKSEAYLFMEIRDIFRSTFIINIVVYVLVFAIFFIVIIYNSVRMNRVLFMFISKHQEYMFQQSSDYIKKTNTIKSSKETSPIYKHNPNNNNQGKENIEHELNESNEGITLISNIEATTNNNIDNTDNEYCLIDDLFDTYCKFYNLNRSKMIRKLEKKREKEKDRNMPLGRMKNNFLQNANEVFELLAWFSYTLPKYQMSIKRDVNFFKKNPLIKKYTLTKRKNMRTIPGMSLKPSKEVLGISQSILCELLSTEAVFDEGIIINLRFNYKNYIQPNVYNYLSSPKKKKLLKATEYKLKEKKRDDLYKELEQECKANDVFKLDEIKSSFHYYLTEVFYTSIKSIYMEMSFEKNGKCYLKK